MMRMRWPFAVILALVVAGSVPAAAQMMGGGSGPMGAALGYERPWISFVLAHEKEVGLTPEQVKALTALRDDFQKEAARLAEEIRDREGALPGLSAQPPAELVAIEAGIREIAARQAELRIARVRAIWKGLALLSDEQRGKLLDTARTMGRMMGAAAPAPAGR